MPAPKRHIRCREATSLHAILLSRLPLLLPPLLVVCCACFFFACPCCTCPYALVVHRRCNPKGHGHGLLMAFVHSVQRHDHFWLCCPIIVIITCVKSLQSFLQPLVVQHRFQRSAKPLVFAS